MEKKIPQKSFFFFERNHFIHLTCTKTRPFLKFRIVSLVFTVQGCANTPRPLSDKVNTTDEE
jgi:hypothetical protein